MTDDPIDRSDRQTPPEENTRPGRSFPLLAPTLIIVTALLIWLAFSLFR